uniref:dolichyl-diphosphooligosaccharide--protein glycotransferase n=1 Tax=Chlamydomonas leiostraca TaxID=1034604 RepID=A0A7S0S2X5_9CHLO|mmetsp:Transcript_5826/g.14477  ORF Transcript_5826/g.14477 Transcript_5826/m.14477 type:complete len:738 (+) Transcript_5826:64-2277(+)
MSSPVEGVAHTVYHHESFSRTIRKYLTKPRSQELLVRSVALVCIYLLAFSLRLFSVVRYESVIHEFDPYFNYRSTIKLVQEGVYEFWNWFDAESWHPLGRVVGGTVYPGLMLTAAAMYRALAWLTAWVKLRDVCVFTAPFFAGNTAMVAYLFGCQLKDRQTGLVAAALMAIVPGYISRSVAGSFDNEAVAIFALVTTFYLWVRAVHLGTISSAVLCAFGYLYMAASWGAYVFISNLIPLYVILMVAINRYSRRLYVAYTTLWAVGSILAMQVRFIGFNHVLSTELLAWNAVFVGLQALELVIFIRSKLTARQFNQFVWLSITGAAAAGAGVVTLLILTRKLNPWTGRFWTLLDPTYAKKFIPIVASVSEHQPTTWASYIFDLHGLVFAAPAGMYFCFKKLTDENIFLITFALTAIYFSGIMVRLMLVAAPAFVLLGAIGISGLLRTYARDVKAASPVATEEKDEKDDKGKAAKSGRKGASSKAADQKGPLPNQKEFALGVLGMITLGLMSYSAHCRWVTSEAYSSPSIVLISGYGPHRHVLDDFREAYYWLRHNTKPDAKIMSWWDYGYQITAMANRTIIVDNNTWNNTHIATVGRAMASNETEAYKIMRALDVDYALVIFGGLSGYSSDDINKFLWMVRIGGGVFPVVKEEDYLNNGEYTVGTRGTPTMLNSIMYKMCYYDFGGIMTEHNQPAGFDRVRQYEIGDKNVKLEHLEEAFTSEHWIVRIFKVKDLANRG